LRDEGARPLCCLSLPAGMLAYVCGVGERGLSPVCRSAAVFLLWFSFGIVVQTATVAEELSRHSLVRRHNEEKMAQLLPSGAINNVRTDRDNDQCNRDYVLNDVEENKCKTGSVAAPILDPTSCNDAANALGLQYKGEKQNDWVNHLHYPQNCFKSKEDSHVYLNPEMPHPVNLTGWSICIEEKFPYADASGNCPSSNYVLIGNDRDECERAHDCKLGMTGCESHSELQWNNGQVESNRISGCYVDTEDCFRYNAGTPSEVTPSTASDRAVCKLA